MAMNLLLTSDIGLLSLFTIGFVVVMGGWLYWFAKRNMAEDAARAQSKQS